MNGYKSKVLAILGAAWLLAGAVVMAAEPAPAASANAVDKTVDKTVDKESAQARAAFYLQDPVPAWITPANVATHKADAKATDPKVYILADTQMQAGAAPAYYVHRAEQINSTTELENAGRLEIEFIPDYQQLHLHGLRIWREGKLLDRTQSAHIRFLQREDGLEQSQMYSGAVTVSILINDLRVGDTLEYEYTVTGQNPVFGGQFVENSGWGDSAPVQWRRVILRSPVATPIYWRYLSDNSIAAPKPTETVAGGWRTQIFQARNLPAIRSEGDLPPDYIVAGWLQFSAFADWNGVAKWAEGLFTVKEPLGPELQAVVARLKTLPTQEQQVVAALEIAQTDIRYFSVALGESSHRPAPPNVVYQRRYGDCKDKALFLHTLLAQLGIASRPVLLDASSQTLPQRMQPSPLAFNHAILQVTLDGKIWYLDPTRQGQHGALANMGQTYGDARVLVVDPASTELARIAPDTTQRIDMARDEVFTLPQWDGVAQLTVTETWRGENAENMRMSVGSASASDLARFVTDPITLRYPKATLVGAPTSQDDIASNSYTLVSHFSVPELAHEEAGSWQVAFDASNFRHTFTRLATAVRTMPFVVGGNAPEHLHYSVQVTLPSEVAGQVDPVVTSLHRKLFNYDATYSMRGNVARQVEDLVLTSANGEAADASAFVSDLRALSQQSSDTFIIAKTDLAGSSATAKGDPIQQQIATRSQRLVDNISKAIAGGKLGSDDLAAAYCFRAAAYRDLGQGKAADSDMALAQKLGASAPVALRCRTEYDFNGGRFQQAIESSSREISLGGTAPRLYYSRAVAQYFNGNATAALADVNRGLQQADGITDPYDQIWAAWLLKRQHLPLPNALAAKADVNQDWPAPVLALFAGKATPEQVLNAAQSKAGLEGRMASTEASFYVGEFYLAQGDTDRARTLFEQSRQQGVTNFYEYAMSGFELKQLQR
ncbi:DUF3857 domain-containing protein [Amantichitinum ursilacus]|uniref:Lipoprotein NlpI n=1 Tax=Amantichitinum ursilacus TaxID=857265 RepID=A0A0N0GQC1_9NEIS|nr:DUF3857 domain-containing protein [Amantichitinum ursilacus]KPC54642.1 Lipoprotein NlpI precursor [Amantichitinum ursilacus]